MLKSPLGRKERAAWEDVLQQLKAASPYDTDGICGYIWNAIPELSQYMQNKMCRRLPPRTVHEAYCWRWGAKAPRVKFVKNLLDGGVTKPVRKVRKK